MLSTKYLQVMILDSDSELPFLDHTINVSMLTISLFQLGCLQLYRPLSRLLQRRRISSVEWSSSSLDSGPAGSPFLERFPTDSILSVHVPC